MFSTDEDLDRADWPLLQNGAINLFRHMDHFEQARLDLVALGYEITVIDCNLSEEHFRLQVSAALQWQQRFGYQHWTGSLDALNDAFRYYPFGSSGRAALFMRGFQQISNTDASRARHILDIIELAARDHLLWGKTLVALIQTDDASYTCDGIGARAALWNRREWLEKDRR